jgi:hypothetical protein
MDGSSLDRWIGEVEVLESDGFVFVVADDVLHHAKRLQRVVGVGVVTGEIEAWSAVVWAVGDVQGVVAKAVKLLAKVLHEDS